MCVAPMLCDMGSMALEGLPPLLEYFNMVIACFL